MSVFDRPTSKELLEAVIDFIDAEIKSDSYPANKKFKFQIRSKKVMKHNKEEENIQNNDKMGIIENRPIMVRETLKQSIIYKNLENGQIYKFQVRIIDKG